MDSSGRDWTNGPPARNYYPRGNPAAETRSPKLHAFMRERIGTAIATVSSMPDIKSYRDLIAWQKALDLADLVYELTEQFPPRERFGLAHQMRKSAVSVPSNIAEGHRRRTPGYLHHLEIALGSHGELDTQSILAFRRGFIVGDHAVRLEALIAEVGMITHGLFRSVESSAGSPRPNP